MKEMPAWARKLREDRMAMGLTQEELANLLGVKRGKIVNIENGRIKNPPPGLLESIESLKDELSEQRQLYNQIQSRPMSEIIAEWKEKLGVERDGELADLLNVTPYSIKRWKLGEVRPLTQAILTYERTVNFVANYLDQVRMRGAREAIYAFEKRTFEVKDPECRDMLIKMVSEVERELGV